MASKLLPTDFVDCTGLRMCLCQFSRHCQAAQAQTGAECAGCRNVNGPVDVSNMFYEFRAEVKTSRCQGTVPMFRICLAELAAVLHQLFPTLGRKPKTWEGRRQLGMSTQHSCSAGTTLDG